MLTTNSRISKIRTFLVVAVSLGLFEMSVFAHESGQPHFHGAPDWLRAFLENLIGQFVTGFTYLAQIVDYIF